MAKAKKKLQDPFDMAVTRMRRDAATAWNNTVNLTLDDVIKSGGFADPKIWQQTFGQWEVVKPVRCKRCLKKYTQGVETHTCVLNGTAEKSWRPPEAVFITSEMVDAAAETYCAAAKTHLPWGQLTPADKEQIRGWMRAVLAAAYKAKP